MTSKKEVSAERENVQKSVAESRSQLEKSITEGMSQFEKSVTEKQNEFQGSLSQHALTPLVTKISEFEAQKKDVATMRTDLVNVCQQVNQGFKAMLEQTKKLVAREVEGKVKPTPPPVIVKEVCMDPAPEILHVMATMQATQSEVLANKLDMTSMRAELKSLK